MPQIVPCHTCLDAGQGGIICALEGLPIRRVGRGNVNSSPVVEKDSLYVGSDDGYVYGLDAATGAQIWRYEIGGAINSIAAIEKKALFIGSTSLQVWAFLTK